MNPPVDSVSFLDSRKALACVHCGLCLSSCPTYLETGNENDSPRGRIHLMRAVDTGRLTLNPAVVRHFDLCLGCRACETACPSGVPYGELLEATRHHVEENYSRSFVQKAFRRWFIGRIFPYPERLEIALKPARWLIASGISSSRRLPERWRELLALLPFEVDSSFTAPIPLPLFSPSAIQPARGRIGLVTGCVMQVLFRATHRNTIRLLNAAGYDVVVPQGQGCCGALFAHSGELREAREAARRLLKIFKSAGPLDAIVTNAAGCGSTLKEYGHFLASDPHASREGARFASQVKDLSEVLAGSDVLLEALGRARANHAFTGRITCQDACHLAHAQRITDAPRILIHAVAGEHFVELPESDVCCGSAGSYNLVEPQMALRLRSRKIRQIASLAPVTVVTTNPGCLMQIRSGLRAAGLATEQARVEHIADWLAALLDDPDATGSNSRVSSAVQATAI